MTIPILSATNNPSQEFIFIVNPASGPGDANSQPDPDYQTCIPQLRPSVNPNVVVLGYVATGAGEKDPSAVDSEIDTYNGWGASFRPNGIFFDQGATDPSFVSLYQGYADTVRSLEGFDFVSKI